MGSSISLVLPNAEPTIKSKEKKVDLSHKHPFPIKFDINYYSLTLFAAKLLVMLLDIITLPFYALYMRPWQKSAANRRIRAKQEDPADPYSAWVAVDQRLD